MVSIREFFKKNIYGLQTFEYTVSCFKNGKLDGIFINKIIFCSVNNDNKWKDIYYKDNVAHKGKSTRTRVA